MFPQSHETCYVQVNDLVRAEGPPLSEGVNRENNPSDRRDLTILDQGNLFISDQRLIFPSNPSWMNRRVRRMRKGHVPSIPGGEASLIPSRSNFETQEVI